MGRVFIQKSEMAMVMEGKEAPAFESGEYGDGGRPVTFVFVDGRRGLTTGELVSLPTAHVSIDDDPTSQDAAWQ